MALEADNIVENEDPAGRAAEDKHFGSDTAIRSFVKRNRYWIGASVAGGCRRSGGIRWERAFTHAYGWELLIVVRFAKRA